MDPINNNNNYTASPGQTAPPQPETVQPEPQPEKAPTFRGGLILGLCIGLVLAIGVGVFGYMQVRSYTALMGDTIDRSTMGKILAIEKVIGDHFYDYEERNLSVDDMREGLYDGLVGSLNDRYAKYFSAEELAAEIADNQGVYYGIGAYVSLEESGYPMLSGIMDDTPAQRAKLHAGDIVVEVDGLSTYGMSLDEVVSHIKGPDGTVVNLTIYREGEDDYLSIDVTRGAIVSKTVTHEMLDDNIGYIRIVQFDYITIEQFDEAYSDIRSQGARGLVLDLRNNPGGLVSAVMGVSDRFLPEGVLFSEEASNGDRTNYMCAGNDPIDIPMVVLVNGYSASAAEILSGAIRDYGVGTLVGTTTYGKGIVQDTYQLSDGSAVELTVGAYYLPGGDNIQGTGIDPDVVIEFDADKYYDDGIDNQLEKGKEILKNKMP